jgi:hypothetical protein
MNYENQLKSQKALDKVAVFLRFYLIFIWKNSGSLNYNDDQVIISQYADDLEFIWKRVTKAYKEGDLTNNFNKTEFIAINTDQKFHKHWRKCHN